MKADDLSLEGLLTPDPDEGLLRIKGDRVLLADVAATYRLAEELAETLGTAGARGVLARYGYQSGYQDAVRLRTHFPWSSEQEWLLAAARTRTILGFARVELREVVVDRAQGVFRVEARATNAFEAEAHKQRLGPGPEPVCHRLAGYLTGYASAFFGDEVLFIEESCAASSDDAHTCRFVGRLKAEWGPRGAEVGRRYQRDAIGERLASRDREVFAQAVTIREQELELAAKAKLEEASRLKNEFLANISHELRTPLNSIIGYTDLLLTKLGAKLPKTPQRNLERILSNAEHLLGLINSVLDISKIEAGRLELRPEAVELPPLLERCLADARVLLAERPVKLQREPLPPDLPLLFADPLRLKQCLTNVLGNAAKFTDQGEIRVRVRVFQARRDGEDQPFVSIAVTDTGPGIAPADQQVIFEPFRQVDASSSRQHEGTGLGLPIVRQLMGLMGGEVRLSSSLGAGSTFTLVVPTRTAEAPTPAEAPSAAPSAPSDALRVLVIDDDPDYLAILREQLADAPGALAGCVLESELSPVEGIAAARHLPPDVILLDLKLPDVDGREALRLLRDDPRTRHVPIVIASVRDDLRETLSEGAFAALEKPLQRAQLLEVLERAVRSERTP
ncbi:MAG: ATP-binding protein [Planctomycetota bacterium]